MARKSQPPQLPSLLHRLWHNAWSDIWGIGTAAAGGIGASMHWVGTVVSDPHVQETVNSLNIPTLGLILTLIGLITYISAEH